MDLLRAIHGIKQTHNFLQRLTNHVSSLAASFVTLATFLGDSASEDRLWEIADTSCLLFRTLCVVRSMALVDS